MLVVNAKYVEHDQRDAHRHAVYMWLTENFRVCELSEHGVILTFGVLDDLWVVGLHDGSAGVGSAEVDTDDAKK